MPDAVVIGAGHHGLVAANLLADAGWDVEVLEATPHVGGAVRTVDGLCAPAYRSDLFSAFYPLAAASPTIGGLHLEDHGLRWEHAPSVLSTVLSGDRAAVLHRDPQRTADSVDAVGPGDGEAWLRLVAEWDEVRPAVLDLVNRPFPPVRGAVRLARSLELAGLLRFLRTMVLPVRRMSEERFRGDGAASLLAGCALHADLSPDAAGSGIYGWLLTMLGQTYGFPVPQGGAGELTAAMTRRLEACGGRVRVDAPVERVEVENGTAVGVRLRGGERVTATRAVLADVNAPALYRELVGLDRLPPRLAADLDRFQWDAPTLKVDWALSAPIPWSNRDHAGAGTVHIGAELDPLTRYAADLTTKVVPREPLVLLGQMTTADPSRSPAGTESAWAYTHLPVTEERLPADVVAAQVERLEATIEQHAPGFRSRVVGRHVQDPYDLQAANPNLVHGSIAGGTAQIHQQLVFRPTPGLGGAATPVDRLFLASASAHPGGGVHGACGANAARAALRQGGVRRAGTRLVQRRLYR